MTNEYYKGSTLVLTAISVMMGLGWLPDSFGQTGNTTQQANISIPNIDWNTVVTGLVGIAGVAGSVLTSYFTNKYTLRKELAGRLHQQRINDYAAIWEHLEAFDSLQNSVQKDSDASTIDNLRSDLLRDLREWYYQKKGGVLLSQESQKAYERLEKELTKFSSGTKKNLPEVLKLKSQLVESLRKDLEVK